MPGRKNPERTESERDHRYRTFEKRSYGDTVQGTRAKDIDERGAVKEVREERRAWAEKNSDGEPEGKPPKTEKS